MEEGPASSFVDGGASSRHGRARAGTARSVARSLGASHSGLRRQQRRHAVHAHDPRRGRLQHARAVRRSDPVARGDRRDPHGSRRQRRRLGARVRLAGERRLGRHAARRRRVDQQRTTGAGHRGRRHQQQHDAGDGGLRRGRQGRVPGQPGARSDSDALKGSTVVSLAVYNFTPEVPEASLQPLVMEALGKL